MFRRNDGLVVTQLEHSRLSGQLAALLGRALGFDHPQLFGAIALHDWPHFATATWADTIEIGGKTDAQQRELLQRLQGQLPLDPFTELIVRLHWLRIADSTDAGMRQAVDGGRIRKLLKQSGLQAAEAARLDDWTELCDSLAFYLARGEVAERRLVLQTPANPRGYQLRCMVTADALEIEGAVYPLQTDVPLLTLEASGYPELLVPVMRLISCRFLGET